jgi:hypothetical protein
MDEGLAAKITRLFPEEDRMNVRSANYLVLRAIAWCPRCAQPTSVFCLGVMSGYESRTEERWISEDAAALLFYVESLSKGVGDLVRELAPQFRIDYSTPVDRSYWVNHCQHCGAIQEDHDLHCEPDAAFLPTSVHAAEQILTLSVQMPFLARAEGISAQPSFLSTTRPVA